MQLIQLLSFNPNFFLFFVLYNIEIFLYRERCTVHLLCSARIAIIDNERTKDYEKRLIEYEPSPGRQAVCHRMSACALTLWCGRYWLYFCTVGGLAYDVL